MLFVCFPERDIDLILATARMPIIHSPHGGSNLIQMTDSRLLLNPSYIKWRKVAGFIPVHIRQKIKSFDFWLPIDLVKWLFIDLQRPHYFHPYGMFFFCGLPGTGKTMFLSKKLADYRKKYGDSIYIGTNYGWKLQDFQVKGYGDILKIYDKPTIIGYDEIQNDFDSRAWASIDYAFSERITQSRKLEGLMIMGTAQKFGFVDKRLRQLTHMVYECRTFFERLTVAKLYEPEVKEKIEAGQFNEMYSQKNKGFSMFVQSDYIRSLYDSYQIIDSVSDKLKESISKPEKIITDLRNLILDDMPRPNSGVASARAM